MKGLLKIGFLGIGVFIILSCYIWYDYVSLQEEYIIENRKEYSDELIYKDDGRISIGVIGDSWAAGEKIDGYLISFLKDYGLDANVISQGHPGAKSKLVYLDMFKSEDDNEYSSNRILFGDHIDICIVLVGVNDTQAYVGAEFYAYHLNLIIKAILYRGITPLIVEIPEYGIEKSHSVTPHGKARRFLMRWVNDNGVIDVIPKYRSIAKSKISHYIENKKIIYFPFNLVSTNYLDSIELYNDDLLHLSKKGNEKLALELAKTIISWKKEKSCM